MSLLEFSSLILEIASLFAVWNHTRRGEPVGWLVAGCAMFAVAAALLAWLPAVEWTSAYLVFAAFYLICALAWSALFEGLHARDWMIGEVFVAVLAAAMIVLAV